MPPLLVYSAILTLAMRRVGDLWEQGRMTVADEHLATAITERVLATVYPALEGGTPLSRERVLMACVEGEAHSLGLRVVGDVLERAGFEVLFLGAAVPLAALVTAVERHEPEAIALSAIGTWSSPAVVSTIDELRGTHPDVPIVVGGPAVPPSVREDRSGAVVADLDHALEAVEAAIAG